HAASLQRRSGENVNQPNSELEGECPRLTRLRTFHLGPVVVVALSSRAFPSPHALVVMMPPTVLICCKSATEAALRSHLNDGQASRSSFLRPQTQHSGVLVVITQGGRQTQQRQPNGRSFRQHRPTVSNKQSCLVWSSTNETLTWGVNEMKKLI